MCGCCRFAVVLISARKRSAPDHRGQLGLQDLERDLPLVLEVVGEVDGGHATLAEFVFDQVAALEGRIQAGDRIRHGGLGGMGGSGGELLTRYRWVQVIRRAGVGLASDDAPRLARQRGDGVVSSPCAAPLGGSSSVLSLIHSGFPMRRYRLLPVLAGALLIGTAIPAAGQTADSATIAGLSWRTIGPANFDGRVNAIAGIGFPSKTFYVGAAGGGVWKTTNNGTTFRPLFTDESTASIGAIAIAQSDTNVVWVGTGDPNSRNTIEPGDGVYKSTDGGMTWKMMGLEDGQMIGNIAIDPTNADVVYVAELGHAWDTEGERGLFKTTDGGATWKRIKYIDEKTGFVDVKIDPSNPNNLFAAAWQRIRGPYFLTSGGPGSGLWHSTDAGETWTEVKGGGFPATEKGRMTVAFARSEPTIVYALVEADSLRGTDHAVLAPASDSVGDTPKKPAAQRLLSGLYRSEDGGATWRWMSDENTRPFYYSRVDVDPENPDRVYFSSTPFLFSDDGGKTTRTATGDVHVDDHAIWIDPGDANHWLIGNDGGVAQTWDRGGNFDYPTNLPIAQFYDVSFDYATPYNVCAGAQDNGAWCGPSARKQGPRDQRLLVHDLGRRRLLHGAGSHRPEHRLG